MRHARFALALSLVAAMCLTLRASHATGDQPYAYAPIPRPEIHPVPADAISPVTGSVKGSLPVSAVDEEGAGPIPDAVSRPQGHHLADATPTPSPVHSLAPRPTQSVPSVDAGRVSASLVLTGIASWYATGGPGIYGAAGPALRQGNWRGSVVTVCVMGGRCLALRLSDWCQCLLGQANERIVDLSLDVVRALGLDPARGLYEVEVMMP